MRLTMICISLVMLMTSGCAWLDASGEEDRIEALEREVMELRARESEAARLEAENLVLEKELETRRYLAAGNQDVPVQEAPRPEPVATAPRSDPAHQEATPSPESAKALYNKALNLTLSEKTTEARPLFQRFLKEHPSSSLAPNAMYWLGETFYHEADYPQAILTFKEVVNAYPDNPKAAAALLKIGFSYSRLNDASNARFYLNMLLADYPDSEPSGLAKAKLAELQ